MAFIEHLLCVWNWLGHFAYVSSFTLLDTCVSWVPLFPLHRGENEGLERFKCLAQGHTAKKSNSEQECPR